MRRAFRRGVFNVKRLTVLGFELMLREQATIQVGHVAEAGRDGGAIGGRAFFSKTAEKQRAQESAVERGVALARQMRGQS